MNEEELIKSKIVEKSTFTKTAEERKKEQIEKMKYAREAIKSWFKGFMSREMTELEFLEYEEKIKQESMAGQNYNIKDFVVSKGYNGK